MVDCERRNSTLPILCLPEQDLIAREPTFTSAVRKGASGTYTKRIESGVEKGTSGTSTARIESAVGKGASGTYTSQN